MLWARWGAVKCVQGQPRGWIAQDYNAQILNSIPDGPFQAVSHDDFLSVIEPSLPPNTSLANKIAILRRSHVLLNTVHGKKNVVYFREAGENPEEVFRFWLDDSDYITAEGKRRIGLWKSGDRSVTQEFLDDVAEEQHWLATLLGDSVIPELPASRRPVREEPPRAWGTLLKRSTRSAMIDLSPSPSPVRPRRSYDLDDAEGDIIEEDESL